MVSPIPAITTADKVLLWLKIVTIFLGGLGTITVIFAADVAMARLAVPTAVGVEAIADIPETIELELWLGYKAAKALDDKEANFHIQKMHDLATDEKQKSALYGIIMEHMPAGHFIHTYTILKELLGDKVEPELPPKTLEVRLALAFMKEGNTSESRAQIEHLLATASGQEKEGYQKAIEALAQGDSEAARLLLTLSP